MAGPAGTLRMLAGDITPILSRRRILPVVPKAPRQKNAGGSGRWKGASHKARNESASWRAGMPGLGPAFPYGAGFCRMGWIPFPAKPCPAKAASQRGPLNPPPSRGKIPPEAAPNQSRTQPKAPMTGPNPAHSPGCTKRAWPDRFPPQK